MQRDIGECRFGRAGIDEADILKADAIFRMRAFQQFALRLGYRRVEVLI